jgi:methionyl-tRNA synthetase
MAYALSVEALRVCGICLQPFTPGAAERLLDALHVPANERDWEHAAKERDNDTKAMKVKLFESKLQPV